MFPFHPIAADAHGAAPSSVSVLISGVFTKTGVYGIIRVSYFLFRSMGLPAMQTGLVLIGCLSMFVCVTMALNQHDFKRLLAFHSISQIGYILTSLGLCTALGIAGGLYHAINHTLFKGLLFLTAGAVLYATGTTLPRKARRPGAEDAPNRGALPHRRVSPSAASRPSTASTPSGSSIRPPLKRPRRQAASATPSSPSSAS